MKLSTPVTGLAMGAVLALGITTGAAGQAQFLDRLPNMYPLNGLSDPYESEDNWVDLPDGREWGSTAGADIDPDGRHIWAIDRCGGNSCAGSNLDPILKIDPDGNVVAAIGGGLFLFPPRAPRGPGRERLGNGRPRAESRQPGNCGDGTRRNQAEPRGGSPPHARPDGLPRGRAWAPPQYPMRRGHRRGREHLHRGRPQRAEPDCGPGDGRPDREIRSGRELHYLVGTPRLRPWGDADASRGRHRLDEPPHRRGPGE